MKADKNILWILAGCILPLILLFFAPVIGIEDSRFMMSFLTILFLIHYLILSKYIENKREKNKSLANNQEEKKIYARNKESISIKHMGLALGTTGVIFYLVFILMSIVLKKQGVIFFLNTLFHGIDATQLVNMPVPWWETVMGIFELFILGWLTGAFAAAIYNLSGKSTSEG